MDLTHWDMVDEFSMREAACLAGGIDPLIYKEVTPEQRAKADLIYREIGAAYRTALSAANYVLNAQNELKEGETIESIFSGFAGLTPLPSSQLICALDVYFMFGKRISRDDIDLKEDMGEPQFSRESLGSWFTKKGVQTIYNFISTSANLVKPVTTSERNSLLTIIAALCDYSAINIKERGAASQIVKMTEEIGAAVSHDTMRRVLSKIPDALETRMK